MIMKENFVELFNNKIRGKKIDWNVSALVAPDGKLYSLGSDSKLIGRIFELISQNVLQEIADENELVLYPSPKQTVYPDFTLMKDENDLEKIAIDIKTTYRKFYRDGSPKGYVFTLGSYASFMRDGVKNIAFPYEQYAKHYVICFVYTRNEKASEGQVYSLEELTSLQIPYKDVEVFVQEKYKIAGEKPGSGNTENIGSYKTNDLKCLIDGEGPFSELGIELFDDYWAGYPKYRSAIKNYTSLDEYFDFGEKNGKDLSRAKALYKYWKEGHQP